MNYKIKKYTLGQRYVVTLSSFASEKFKQKKALVTLISLGGDGVSAGYSYDNLFYEGYIGGEFYHLIHPYSNHRNDKYVSYLFEFEHSARFYEVIYFNSRDIYIPFIKKLFKYGKNSIKSTLC